MDRGAMVQDDTKKDYYGLLGISTKATQKEIKERFNKIACQYHPDKNHDKDTTQEFAAFAEAYDVLSDPVSRALYDMLVGIKPESAEELRRLNSLKKAQAKKAISNMEATVEQNRQAEIARNGLIILEALYGDLLERKVGSKKLNVTVPLQCLVDNSALIIPGGASKAWIDGFYDPTEGGENELYVRYKFLGRLHECQVGDKEELCIPLQEHLVEEEEPVQQTYKQKREAKREEDRVKRKRRFMLFSAIALFLGYFLVRKTETYANIKTSVGNFTSPYLIKLFGSKSLDQ